MKDIKLKRKHYLLLIVLGILLLSLFTGCSDVKQVFTDTDKLVSTMTKSDLLWSILIMSFIVSSISG